MFVHHPFFSVGEPGTQIEYGTSYRSCGPEQNTRSCIANLTINAIYAALFILPRPVTNQTSIPPIPTSFQPFWRPSSYIFRRIGMTDSAIESTLRNRSLRRPLRQMAQQLRVPEEWLAIKKAESDFGVLQRIDEHFDEAFFDAKHAKLGSEYALATIFENDLWMLAHPCNRSSMALGSAMKGMIKALTEKHKRLCSLPADMPLEKMRKLV